MNTKSETRTFFFMVFSCIAHVAMAVAVLTMSIQPQPKLESVQVEIVSAPSAPPISPPATQPVSHSAQTQDQTEIAQVQPEKSQTEIAPAQAEKSEVAQELPRPKQSQVKPVPVKPKLARTLPPARKSAEPLARPETPVQEDSPVVLPTVVNENLQETPPESQPELKDDDIASDLEKVDQQQAEAQENAKAAALNADIQKEADAEMKEQEEKLLAIQKQNELESQTLAKENMQKRAQERAALAAAQAQAAHEAAQAQENAKAAAQAKEQAARAASENQKQAAAGSGGIAQGEAVRSVEDLKQVPGNQRPQYDKDDRLQGRQGEVAFLAYVTKDGVLSEFKLLKSTGHRELDGKTLKAIKSWKFYPGQEGWVEIPYRWSLKGGAQPIGPILRTKRSASINETQPTSSRN